MNAPTIPETNTSPEPGADAFSAETNRLNAEAIRCVAEANASRLRQLRDLEAIGAWLQRSLAAEAGRLQQLDEDLRQREAKVLEAERLYQTGAELHRQAQTQAQENQRLLAEAQARKTEADQAEQTVREESERVQTQLWPSALRAAPWRPWRERLLRRAAAEGAAGLLLARLHAAAALERAGRPLALELVRELGRSVYETCSEDAERIAQALSQAAGGRFEIRTVRAGDRIDNKFMKPSVGGLVEVRTVSGWAIRDNNGLWQFPAEVA